jgi:integrase
MARGKIHWSYSAGERGRNRVRAYEDAKTGVLHLEFYEPVPGEAKPKRKALSLGHRDRERAKQQADELAAKFGRAEQQLSGDITLRELFDIYGREVTPQKSERSQRHDHGAAEMFLRFFGRERKALSLSRRDWDAFIKERGAGRIRPAHKQEANRVGPRTIARDLLWLRAVLNWATTAGDGKGSYLLERNPLKGFPIPREESPNRPIMTPERYEAMLEVAEGVDWRFYVALVLAHETGHRIKAIRHLRWGDVDLENEWLTWRGDEDKIGHEHRTPLTPAAIRALLMAREHDPGIGEAWVMPSPKHPDEPCSPTLMRSYWHQAEKAAGLERVPRLGWHGLRRMFATDLKHVPLKDLCALGGWKTHQTIVSCYQQEDEHTMRRALESRRRVEGAGAR